MYFRPNTGMNSKSVLLRRQVTDPYDNLDLPLTVAGKPSLYFLALQFNLVSSLYAWPGEILL